MYDKPYQMQPGGMKAAEHKAPVSSGCIWNKHHMDFIARFWQYFLEQLCTASWKLVLYFIWYNYFTLSQQDLLCELLITETLQGVESVNGLGGQHMQVRC